MRVFWWEVSFPEKNPNTFISVLTKLSSNVCETYKYNMFCFISFFYKNLFRGFVDQK